MEEFTDWLAQDDDLAADHKEEEKNLTKTNKRSVKC